MWKTLNRKYVKVLSLFTKSGQQEEDFFGYCGGSIDVYYLRECLHLKPDLTQFVEGGLLEADEFDSLKHTAENQRIQQSTPSKKLKC
ncbi:hypothetical protein PHMEG_00035710 [Phytophthora megakarya]|uniref:Uncharacterized protein n=1 Tax=Phytophthora megakarya TaxID=4795 RepID=A0A225UMR6_9STRA|nr:hypothetical protein PHMEG_00035710 [Phytophthora megakarya]